MAREAWRLRCWGSSTANTSSREVGKSLSQPQNALLARLPRAELKAVLALCDTVELVFGTEIYQPGDSTSQVYFPRSGYLSLISSLPKTPKVEIGMVGREGFIGTQLVLGVPRAPWIVLVQGEGVAERMPALAFKKALEGAGVLKSVLMRYMATLMVQFSIAAPCLRFHEISPRLARWLLMTQDRADASVFRATHEYLSYMLGVRRAGVTEAAGALQRTGAIRYERGMVTVLDRALLEQAACSCYAADIAAYHTAMRAAK